MSATAVLALVAGAEPLILGLVVWYYRRRALAAEAKPVPAPLTPEVVAARDDLAARMAKEAADDADRAAAAHGAAAAAALLNSLH
jgi:hypothetical protein